MKKTDLLIISHLRRNARMKLTDMSRQTRIPVSSIFDRIRVCEGSLIRKHTALVRFEALGFSTRAMLVLGVGQKDRESLKKFLEAHPNVNSLFRINNGYDYMAEVIFPGVREVEDFMEKIEGKVRLKQKKAFYILNEIRKEEFLAKPELVGLVHDAKDPIEFGE
jgi:DNA-binding Lrp family transcriptional regulator